MGAFFIGLGGFLIFVSLELLYQLSDLIVRYKVGIDKLFLLIYYNLPYFIVLGIPVGVLLAIFWTLSRMQSDNELIALQTHGITLKTVVLPFVIFAVLLSGITYLFNDYIVPYANRKAYEAQARFIYRRPEVTLKENAFMEDGKGRYLYIKKIDPETGELKKILLYDLSGGKTRVTSAKSATKEGGKWIMHDGRVFELDSKGFLTFDMSFESLELDFGSDIQEYIRQSKSPREMTSAELKKKIASFSRLGVRTSPLMVALQEKYSLSLAPLVIVMIGVPLSLIFNLRSKSWSVILTFILIVIYQGSGAWLSAMGKEDLLNPAFAPWIPNIIFAITGIITYLLIDTRASYRLGEFLSRFFRFGVLLLFIFSFTVAFSAKVSITAGDVSGSGREIYLTNGVEFTYTSEGFNATVSASNASILLKDETPLSISFWGNVVMHSDEKIIEAQRLIIDLTKETIEVMKVRTRTEFKISDKSEEKIPFFVYGELAESTMEPTPTLMLKEGYLTTCDLKDHPHYRFVVSSAEVEPGKYVIVKNLLMKILDVPVFYLPWYYFPLDDPERRPFQIDLSSIQEWKTITTLRYLDIDWLLLALSWERNWQTTEDIFTLSAKVEPAQEFGTLRLLCQYGDGSPASWGGYALYEPGFLPNYRLNLLAVSGTPSELLKEPFKRISFANKKIGSKSVAADAFTLKSDFGMDRLYLFNLTGSNRSKDLEYSLGFSGALFEREDAELYLWNAALTKLSVPANFSMKVGSGSFAMKTLSGSLNAKRFIEYTEDQTSDVSTSITIPAPTYTVTGTLSLTGLKLDTDVFTTRLQSFSFKLESTSSDWGEILASENIEDFIFEAKRYEVKLGRFTTTGDIESTFDASDMTVNIKMPYTTKSIGKNRFSYASKDSKLKISGNYALDYSTDSYYQQEHPKLFWIEPFKISYEGWLDFNSSIIYTLYQDNSWALTADNALSKTLKLLDYEFKGVEFSSFIVPKFSWKLTKDAPASFDLSSISDYLSEDRMELSLKNSFNLTPLKGFSAGIEYNPTVVASPSDLFSGIFNDMELTHPGRLAAKLKTGIFDVNYNMNVDYSGLFPTRDASFFGTGTLEISGKIAKDPVSLSYKTDSELQGLSATETSLEFSLAAGSFSHKMKTVYDWSTGNFGNIEGNEKIEYKEGSYGFTFDLGWTADIDQDGEDENKLSLNTTLRIGDDFKTSLKFSYPYVYRKKNYFDRIRLELGEFSTPAFSMNKAIIDFTTGYARFSKYDNYKAFPAKYFSTFEVLYTTTPKYVKFFYTDIASLKFGNVKLEGFYLASASASSTGEPTGEYEYAIGVQKVVFDGKTLVSGTGKSFENYGISVSFGREETLKNYFILSMNDLRLGKSLLRHIKLQLKEGESYFQIGLSPGSYLDWSELYRKEKPLYIDLHCMALEGILELNLSPTSLADVLNFLGLKYYIKAMPDRYLVFGLSQGYKPFFKFKF